MIFNLNQSKPEVKRLILNLFGFAFLLFPAQALAITDPLSVPNNKFGIHIISPTHDESLPAAQLVNSSGGDWGYITVLIESEDRKTDKWQTFFNDLRRKHLIPLVRIATKPIGSNWKIPDTNDATDWANFLDTLTWPTKNRYVIVYNEPNQGQEWEGQVNATHYAKILNQTIDALKAKNPDFFVLNGGLDASAPYKLPLFQDELSFLKEMDQAVPGIFNKLDGWVSHSYPNPGFAGSPDDIGRGTVRTWIWEQRMLQSLGLSKTLPIFITETGWKHAEGLDYDKSLPSADTIGEYFKKAFQYAWNSSQIVAVTPFLLTYLDSPFDHFSFKKPTGNSQNMKILGASFPEYYPHYETLLSMAKTAGKPAQENKAQLTKGSIYHNMVSGESYTIPLTFKNTGQSIWGDGEKLELRAIEGGQDLGILPAELSVGQKIEPGQEASFNLRIHTPKTGDYKISLQLFHEGKAFDQPPFDFPVQVDSPVILIINSTLGWKKDFSGSYFLDINSNLFQNTISFDLDNNGKSKPIEARYLLPNYNFTFTITKPFYKQKSIQVIVKSGMNTLNFGELEPDFLSAALNPQELWNLLPFSK